MSRQTTAIIQARMGSTRLPGKVLLPLDCEHVIAHDVRRVHATKTIDEVVIATSTEKPDDAIDQFAKERDISIHRGSEANVQQRMFDAAAAHDAETVVRITADCPLIDPNTIDVVVSRIQRGTAEYVTNIINRTFPRGLDVEAFTYDSFERVVAEATTEAEREHVTPYYRENPDKFEIENISSTEVFEEEKYLNRTDLRLTLDEAADYRLLKRIYDEIKYTGTLSIRDTIDYVDATGLDTLNEEIRQKMV